MKVTMAIISLYGVAFLGAILEHCVDIIIDVIDDFLKSLKK